jgi:hypothetical protein
MKNCIIRRNVFIADVVVKIYVTIKKIASMMENEKY